MTAGADESIVFRRVRASNDPDANDPDADADDGGDVRNLGKPVELAGKYFKQGADEVAFLNITGYRDLPLTDAPMLEVLRRSSETVFVPLTVGGGIRDFTDSNGKSYTVSLFLFPYACGQFN